MLSSDHLLLQFQPRLQRHLIVQNVFLNPYLPAAWWYPSPHRTSLFYAGSQYLSTSETQLPIFYLLTSAPQSCLMSFSIISTFGGKNPILHGACKSQLVREIFKLFLCKDIFKSESQGGEIMSFTGQTSDGERDKLSSSSSGLCVA